MKTIAISIITIIVFTGCNKPPNFDPDNSGEAKALKNGEEWSAVGRIGFNHYNTDLKDTINLSSIKNML